MTQRCLLAAIADDFSGGSDLAGMLYEGGAPVVQIFGLPDESFIQDLRGRFAAVVLSLKSRSIPVGEACAQSLRALEFLEQLEPEQIQFKFCSTFDSTREGNIGPVTEALLDRLGQRFTVAVPALPVNKRTQYMGHLFVGSQLLSDSPLRNHPLNPMTEPNLVSHLQAQLKGKAGLIDLHVVRGGADALRDSFRRLTGEGISIALVDAIENADLTTIAEACADLKFITAGSGLATGLTKIWKERGLVAATTPSAARKRGEGGSLVLSGSCSAATLGQLEALGSTRCTMLQVPSDELPGLTWLGDARAILEREGELAIYSSAPSEKRHVAPEFFEQAFRIIAAALAPHAARVIVAGGETSGAVVEALRIRAVEITGILDPGVPMLRTIGERPIGLTLKSGNFGSRDFFRKAIETL